MIVDIGGCSGNEGAAAQALRGDRVSFYLLQSTICSHLLRRGVFPMQFFIDNWMLELIIVLSGAMLLWPLVQGRFSKMKEVGTLHATQLINRSNAVLLDVRAANEFAVGHLPNALNIPLAELGTRARNSRSSRRAPSSPIAIAASAAGRRERRSPSWDSPTSTSSPADSRRGRMPACRCRNDAARSASDDVHDVALPVLRAGGAAADAQGRHRRGKGARRFEPERRAEMMHRTGRRSVPQIYIGERHVGGYRELAALDRAGELDSLLGNRPT